MSKIDLLNLLLGSYTNAQLRNNIDMFKCNSLIARKLTENLISDIHNYIG